MKKRVFVLFLMLVSVLFCGCVFEHNDRGEFSDIVVQVEYQAESGGKIVGESIQYIKAGGSGSLVTAVADRGYEFIGWSDGVTSPTRQDTIITKDFTVYALFTVANLVYTTIYDTDGAYKDGEKITSFSVEENRGKVIVLNFWYTACAPCVAELPAFNRVKEEYGDKIAVVAVHDTGLETNATIQKFIDEDNRDKMSWSHYSIIFALDSDPKSYDIMGGNGSFPMTVILNTEGEIVFIKQGSMYEQLLKSEIDKALATQ